MILSKTLNLSCIHMSNLNILRTYAQKPASLPASIKFKETPKNITIFDIYPKSIFHFLVLPRIQPPKLTAGTLNNLQTLLSGDQACAKEVILGLAEDAKTVKEEIQKEMIQRFGFKWDVWIGFHGAPSMSCVLLKISTFSTFIHAILMIRNIRHLHLHIISADLCSEKMKNKKHYNSFHPKLGFFLHIDEVTSWFDADHTFFSTKVSRCFPCYRSSPYNTGA